MAVDWAVSTAKKVLAHLDVEAFPNPVADVIEREIRPLLEDWRKGVELVYAAVGESNPIGLSCVKLADKVLAIMAEHERLSEENEKLQKVVSVAMRRYDGIAASVDLDILLRAIGEVTWRDSLERPRYEHLGPHCDRIAEILREYIAPLYAENGRLRGDLQMEREANRSTLNRNSQLRASLEGIVRGIDCGCQMGVTHSVENCPAYTQEALMLYAERIQTTAREALAG